eukprot:6194255-Pleurochrysis_carterae.AAC.1
MRFAPSSGKTRCRYADDVDPPAAFQGEFARDKLTSLNIDDRRRPDCVQVALLVCGDRRGPLWQREGERGRVGAAELGGGHNVAVLILGPDVLDQVVFCHAVRHADGHLAALHLRK